MTLAHQVFAALDRLRTREGFDRLGIAVSGGGDSVALLLLAEAWGAARGGGIEAVSVDHGLRPEAEAEARSVAELCKARGIRHEILRWQGWQGLGNLQQAAREARRTLISDWAARRGLSAVALGHTRDDQAETLLLRLARGSGVDGLAAMAEASGDAPRWLRPLLDTDRAALRAWLDARGVGWVEDPSNEDESFDRVKARRALASLAPLGLEPERLAETAGRMRQAREALERMALLAARDAVRLDRGDVLLDGERFAAWPEETRLRLLAHAIGWVTGAPYRPRLSALRDAAEATRARTLAGALVSPGGGRIRVTREAEAAARSRAVPGDVWDARWRVSGPARPGDAVAALGQALDLCPIPPENPLPRPSLRASPGVWRAGELIAAPLAGHGTDWTATLVRDDEVFYTSLLSR